MSKPHPKSRNRAFLNLWVAKPSVQILTKSGQFELDFQPDLANFGRVSESADFGRF